MTSLRLCFLGPLSILCFQIAAQVDDLMKDKNITWMAESYNDFVTDQAVDKYFTKQLSIVTPLKFLNIKEQPVPEDFVFERLLMEAVNANKIAIYKDANCKIVGSKEDLVFIDTVQICFRADPETGATFWVSKTYPDGEGIYFFRAHQILYYNAKKVQFGLQTIAIAPMKRKYDDRNHIGWTPLFWMKVTDLSKNGNLSDDAITWAKQMNLRDGVALKADSVKILKQIDDNMLIASLFQAFLTKPNIPFYTADSMPLWVKYSFIERRKLFIQRDTISCSGGEPMPKPKILNNDIHPNRVLGLRLIQNWYWDDKRKRLEIYLVATAPIIDVKNEAGEFLYKYPLFYRRTDD